MGIDSHQVNGDSFLQDTSLEHLFPIILKQDFLFGGSCFCQRSARHSSQRKQLTVETPVVKFPVSENIVNRLNFAPTDPPNGEKIGIDCLGLQFLKTGSGLYANSSHRELIETPNGKGIKVAILRC